MDITKKLQWNLTKKKKELENYPFISILKIIVSNWLRKNKWTQEFHKDVSYTVKKFLEPTINPFWVFMILWSDKMSKSMLKISEFMIVTNTLENFIRTLEFLNKIYNNVLSITSIILCRINMSPKKILAWWII